MTKGTKVRVVKLTTERGKTWDSLRSLMDERKVGSVIDDATGALSWKCSVVDFGRPELTLNVPDELLQAVRA